VEVKSDFKRLVAALKRECSVRLASALLTQCRLGLIVTLLCVEHSFFKRATVEQGAHLVRAHLLLGPLDPVSQTRRSRILLLQVRPFEQGLQIVEVIFIIG